MFKEIKDEVQTRVDLGKDFFASSRDALTDHLIEKKLDKVERLEKKREDRKWYREQRKKAKARQDVTEHEVEGGLQTKALFSLREMEYTN